MKSYEDRQPFTSMLQAKPTRATPRRFRLDGRAIEIAENINRWYGPGYRYLRLS